MQNLLPNFTMTLKQLAIDLHHSFTCELVTYSWTWSLKVGAKTNEMTGGSYIFWVPQFSVHLEKNMSKSLADESSMHGGNKGDFPLSPFEGTSDTKHSHRPNQITVRGSIYIAQKNSLKTKICIFSYQDLCLILEKHTRTLRCLRIPFF